jgi:sarcosine oxidase subunit beta
MAKTADAIIIGTGVIGAAVAFELAKKGYKTLSVDRTRMAGQGSTAGSCAIIRMHYSTYDGTAFAWEGYHYWRDWAEYLGLASSHTLAKFIECGCMVMKTEQNGHLVKHLENSRALNIAVEEWGPDEITRRLPVFDLARFFPVKRRDENGFGEPTSGAVSGAVFWPNGGYVTDPALSAQNLVAAAKQHGSEFKMGVEVTDILKGNGAAAGVRLSSGAEIHAPIVINVGGPGSAHINGLAGVLDKMTIATRPLRQEVVHVPAPDGFDYENRGFVVSDSDIGCYSRPEYGNHILVGSEDPPCDGHVWAENDKDYDRNFTDQWTTQAMRYGQRVPSLAIPSKTRGVVDLYDASTDWIPIYDKSSLDGFYMACGTSGNQYKNAPIAGKLMADLVDYCENGTDHDETPLQFRLPYVDRIINAGFYSRKRAINKESSFSVLG